MFKQMLAVVAVLAGIGLTDAQAAMEATPVVTGLSGLRDAATDRRGKHFFYIADGSRGPAVFRVTLKNGRVEELYSGAPLVAPRGITAAEDEDEVYIADPQAAGGGAVFVLDGDRLRRLVSGYQPRGIEAADGSVYFTGHNPRNGQPGLYRVHAGGGRVGVVAEGAPFVHPVGVAIGRQGDAWVSDALSEGSGVATVVHVKDRQATTFVATPLRAGTPPGIALTADESTVALSGLGPDGRALVYLIDTTSRAISTANNGISQISGAGGLHRSANGRVFSWCGPPLGPVFKVTFD